MTICDRTAIPGLRAIPDWLAPCGRDCERCPDYQGFTQGFAQTSSRLLRLLENYPFSSDVARETGGFDFAQFMLGLTWFAGQINLCGGCASGPCVTSSRLLPGCDPGCPIRVCAHEKNITLCAFCDAFPCQHSGYSRRGLESLLEIRRVGLEKWLVEREASLAASTSVTAAGFERQPRPEQL